MTTEWLTLVGGVSVLSLGVRRSENRMVDCSRECKRNTAGTVQCEVDAVTEVVGTRVVARYDNCGFAHLVVW